MAFEFELRVFGEAVISRRLVRFADTASDLTEVMSEVAGVLSAATAENFATRGESGGSRWRDLKPATVARKERLGLDPRILFATERLYHSLVGADSVHGARSSRTGRFAPGGKDHIEKPGPTGLEWGSRVPYGKYHQSSAPRRRIPYRPPVRLNEGVKRQISKTIQRGLLAK